jgi:general stress protein 26
MMKVIATCILATGLLTGCAHRGSLPPTEEFYRVAPEADILKAARALVESDGWAALISIDEQGRPRVRTVGVVWNDEVPSDPRKTMTLWVQTRHTTRKVSQIRRNPRVALYFSDDAAMSYLSIMGLATVHTDPADPHVQPRIRKEWIDYIWPEYPNGFVMIEVKPTWIEYMGPGFGNHPQHWRPQATDLSAGHQ